MGHHASGLLRLFKKKQQQPFRAQAGVFFSLLWDELLFSQWKEKVTYPTSKELVSWKYFLTLVIEVVCSRKLKP